MSDGPGKAPISRDPATVMARILDAAQAEFMGVGYDAASTNRVTAAFGGSKATLFRHYPTKQALLGGVVRRIATGWEGRVDPTALPADDPRVWLTGFTTALLDWILGADALFVGRLGIAEGHKLPELAGVFHAGAGAPLQAVLAERLAVWTEAGLLACAAPAADAQHFFDLAVAGVVSRALYGAAPMTTEERAEHIGGVVDLFLAARREG